LFLHIRSPNHGLRSSFEDGLHIIPPSFSTKAILGADDVYLDAVPLNYHSDGSNSSHVIDTTNLKCHHVTQLSKPNPVIEKKEDNLLCNLQHYYGEVKTKRQLNLEVPAGFRQKNTFQHQVQDFQLSTRESSVLPDSSDLESLDSSVNLTINPPDAPSSDPLPNV
jgi:hypothetical protein